jgi:hypothetical protein
MQDRHLSKVQLMQLMSIALQPKHLLSFKKNFSTHSSQTSAFVQVLQAESNEEHFIQLR